MSERRQPLRTHCPYGHAKEGERKQTRTRVGEVAVSYLPYCKVCARGARAKAAKGLVGIEVPRGLYLAISAYAKATGQTVKAVAEAVLRDGLRAFTEADRLSR